MEGGCGTGRAETSIQFEYFPYEKLRGHGRFHPPQNLIPPFSKLPSPFSPHHRVFDVDLGFCALLIRLEVADDEDGVAITALNELAVRVRDLYLNSKQKERQKLKGRLGWSTVS